MDEKDCELLLKLYEIKNITKTAEKLYITQPAITKRIQKIETELQCEILLRSKKGVVFTPAGESIIPYAASILKNSKLLKEQALLSKNKVCGTLNIGCSLNFAHYYLPKILKKYTTLYPDVDVQIIAGQSKDLYNMLQRDEISFAILRGEFQWADEMKLVSSEPMCLVCSNDNVGRPLSDYPYIGHHTDVMLDSLINNWLASHNLSNLKPKFWINNIDACKELAKQGLGWCILPKICLDNFDGYVEELFLNDKTPFVRNTYVLYKQPYDKLTQVKLFLELLNF